MSVQENSRINEEYFAAVNAHDIDRYLDLLSDDFVMRNINNPEPVRGKDAARQVLEDAYAAFPDYHVELKNAVVSDDQIAVELEFSGTHDGPFTLGPGAPPLPATGKPVRTQGIFVATVKDGKVVEVHLYPDSMGMMMQLGLISPPGSE